MARIELHTQPRPGGQNARAWFVPMRSTAGGRVPERPIRVRYQHPRPDNPERTKRDGLLLISITIVVTAIAGFFLWAGGLVAFLEGSFDSVNAFLLRAVPAALLVTWWIMFLRMIFKSAANRRGRRIIRGTVVEHSCKNYSYWLNYTEYTYTNYYLALDDGTSDQVEGWEVPVEAWNLFPIGTNAEALVTGDGRYAYYIAHL